ncbi:MAG: hypothetical protein EHM43_10055, partial [Ignavibacteriae bacterium]
MKNFVVMVIASWSCLVTHAAAQERDTMPRPYERLNIGGDDYAISFRAGRGVYEVWSTSGSVQNDLGSRRLLVTRPHDGADAAPRPVNMPPFNDDSSMYVGVTAFHPCDPDNMLFVTDRKFSGRRTSNDIYHGTWNGTQWMMQAASFNSEHWDDTPVFGRNGSTIYFSSDRRLPGSGRADLYVVRRAGDGWSAPQLLGAICSDTVHEVSPFVGTDGRLYYASNISGDLDIWSVALDDAGLPTGTAQPLTIPGVNQRGSNELHPVIAPDGTTFAFSSDRGVGRAPYRIYSISTGACTTTIDISVVAKTQRKDVQLTRLFGSMDSISYVSTTVRIRDRLLNVTDEITTDLNGRGRYTIRSASGDGIGMGERTRTFEVTATPRSSAYVGSTDTLVVSVAECGQTITHQVFLHDTTVVRTTCDFVFRTFNVPFFITAYWCPTTRKYRDYTPCASLFTDDLPCNTLVQPEACASNEAYTYEFVPAVVRRIPRRNENCVRYDEFNSHGPEWAEQVDVAIERMRDEVAAVFNETCVQEAVRRGLPLNVVMFGTTDDRSIDPKCQYTGKAYEDVQEYLGSIQVDEQIRPFIKTHQRFNSKGYGGRAGGNQLLSDLRSMYFAIMFDRLCRESIPLYARLRQ